MAIDENTLSKGQLRKLAALRRYVDEELGDEAFGKWMTRQAAAAEVNVDPVAQKIEQALAGFAGDRTLNLGNYGYTVRWVRGKGASGFIATKNAKP